MLSQRIQTWTQWNNWSYSISCLSTKQNIVSSHLNFLSLCIYQILIHLFCLCVWLIAQSRNCYSMLIALIFLTFIRQRNNFKFSFTWMLLCHDFGGCLKCYFCTAWELCFARIFSHSAYLAKFWVSKNFPSLQKFLVTLNNNCLFG